MMGLGGDAMLNMGMKMFLQQFSGPDGMVKWRATLASFDIPPQDRAALIPLLEEASAHLKTIDQPKWLAVVNT